MTVEEILQIRRVKAADKLVMRLLNEIMTLKKEAVRHKKLEKKLAHILQGRRKDGSRNEVDNG